MNKIREFFFKLLTGKSLNTGISITPTGDELDSTVYLFDFKNWSSSYRFENLGNSGTFVITGNDTITVDGGIPTPRDETFSKLPTKIKVRPKDVLNELETVPTPFTLTLIDEKIEILKDKIDLIRQKYAKREVEALLERMHNRKLNT
jgi:hypothetical protein